MEEITATTSRRPEPRRSRRSKSAMPTLPAFSELCCSEPTHTLDDIILSGSDDEYYDSPSARSRRLEEQARLFLEGRRPLLLSASLRGPFGRETGWENPWRGRVSKASKKGAVHSSRASAPLALTSDAGVESRKWAAVPMQSRFCPEPRGRFGRDLGAAPDITYTDKEPQVKKRAAGADWLLRRNLKRMRPDDNELTASPTPSRISKAAATPTIPTTPSDPKTPRLAPSVSAPVEDKATTSIDTKLQLPRPSESGDGTKPLAPNADVAARMQQCTTTCGGDATDLLVADANVEGTCDGLLPQAGVLVSGRNPDMEEHDDEPVGDQHSVSDEHTTSHPDNNTPTTLDTETDTGTVESERIVDNKLDNDRLATQDQSPWAKTETGALVSHMAMDDEVGSLDTGVHSKSVDGQAPNTAQSPWTKEGQTLLPAPEALPEFESLAEDGPGTSLIQNPWADTNAGKASFSSSLTNLPTSPCSPSQKSTSLLPDDKSNYEHEHGHDEPFLPSLPIPIPVANLCGTAPSTPETKQSSLPTPDMTVSIKSFRRFRSPTPTPPPRRQSAKSGGARSILSHPRRRSGAVKSASNSGRRVQFNLPQDEEEAHEDGEASTEVTRAASPPPPDEVLMESLPSEVDRFKSHFATVVGRAGGQQTSTTAAPSVSGTISMSLSKRNEALLEQGIHNSSPVDAMASRFLEADADMSKLQQISTGQSQQSLATPRLRQNSSDVSNKSLGARDGDDKENATRVREDDPLGLGSVGDDLISSADDVQDVMDNLDEFLGLWDMDAELAQARSGRI